MMIHNPALLPKLRSPALLRAVRDMPCALRLAGFFPGHGCSAQDTVVPCHLDRTIGKGMGTKVSDLFVAAGCLHCHDILDGRDRAKRDYIAEHYPAALMDRMLRGLAETQARWLGMGLITVEGADVA